MKEANRPVRERYIPETNWEFTVAAEQAGRRRSFHGELKPAAAATVRGKCFFNKLPGTF